MEITSEPVKNETSTEKVEDSNSDSKINLNSKYKNYRSNIGKNIKSASSRIKNINGLHNLKNNEPKQEENKKADKKVSKDKNDSSISFDDAMDSIDDLMEDSEN